MITFKEFLTEAAKKKDKLPANIVSKWDREDLSIEKMIEIVNAKRSMNPAYVLHLRKR